MPFDIQVFETLNQLIIPHAPFVNARQAVLEALDEADHYADKSILPLIGPSRAGKTRLLEYILNAYGSEPRCLIRTSLPRSERKKAMLMKILEALGDPMWDCGTDDKMQIRLIGLLRDLGIKYLIADEFQHCVSTRGAINYAVADLFKVLLDEAQVTIIAAGLERTADVLSSNEQLEGRCLPAVHLPRFDWNDPESRAEFMGVVGAFGSGLGSIKMPAFDDEDACFRWWVASGGLIGYVHKIFRKLLTHLQRNNKMKATLNDFHEAHAAAVYYRGPRVFPFDSKFDLKDKVTGLPIAARIGERRDIDAEPSDKPRRKAGKTGEA